MEEDSEIKYTMKPPMPRPETPAGATPTEIWYDRAMTDHRQRALLARIASEPGKMGGKPVIRGRRITPAMVLKMMAGGATRAQVLEAYPVLEDADIDACLLYGALVADRADPALVPAD